MHVTRREFMLQTGQACLGYAARRRRLCRWRRAVRLINAFAQGADYRALVCVFLAGGNDGNNMVVPLSTTEYKAYSTVRSASGLAHPARHSAADHAAGDRQQLRTASEPGRRSRPVGRAEAVGRLQRRSARAAADP